MFSKHCKLIEKFQIVLRKFEIRPENQMKWFWNRNDLQKLALFMFLYKKIEYFPSIMSANPISSMIFSAIYSRSTDAAAYGSCAP